MQPCHIVTLSQNLKYVEKAIYAAKLPNVIPQKVDGRTLKIVIPRFASQP